MKKLLLIFIGMTLALGSINAQSPKSMYKKQKNY